MDTSEPPPEKASQIPGVIDSIPSTVRQSAGGNAWTWIGLGLVAAVLALAALLQPHKKRVTETATSGAAPAELPAVAPETTPLVMPPPRSRPMARTESSGFAAPSGDGDFWQARLHSPMVIFNGATSGASLPGLSALRGALQPGAVTTSVTAGAASPPDGAPLPAHFTPSSAASVHSTDVGDREYVIGEGKLLDAVLESAINSDHPGLLRALIADDIYGDSGRTVLLPRGTRLVGQYDADVSQGQNRVFVLWQRAIRPDGIDIQLGSAGTDPLGETGIEGRVNEHFVTMFGAAALLSVIGASASTVGVSATDQPNSVAEYREAVTQGFGNAANNVLSRFTQIKPTITVRQGMPIKVFVAKDLYFDAQALAQSQGIEVVP